jgi:hypothetical protein
VERCISSQLITQIDTKNMYPSKATRRILLCAITDTSWCCTAHCDKHDNVGSFAVTVAYPSDLVRRRMQLQGLEKVSK